MNSQELASNYEALFAAYSQLEMNQKAKAETEAKFNTMVERLRAGQLQAGTLERLSSLLSLIE